MVTGSLAVAHRRCAMHGGHGSRSRGKGREGGGAGVFRVSGKNLPGGGAALTAPWFVSVRPTHLERRVAGSQDGVHQTS
jgi:hypothetical protein